jgi:importin-4
LDLCGRDVLTKPEDVAKVCEQILAVIKGKHPCQVDEEEDEDEDVDEFSEYDWLVVETAMDCLVALAKALREQFAPIWKEFEKPIVKHASSEEGGERAAATGTIAECIRGMDKAVTPYTHSLMKIAIHRMGDDDIVAKANAIYAAGLLCQYSEDSDYVLKQYSTILRKLEPQLSDDASGHLLDNAAGCVARMIMAYPDKVPLDDVLPVLVNLAPAKEDYEVNGPIYQCIVRLCMYSRTSICTEFTANKCRPST